MENVNFGSFNLSVARPGTKVSTSSRPELILVPTINKFSLNSLASKLMDVEAGDHVTILTNDDASNLNEMYFITTGIGDEGQSKLASIGNKPGTGRLLNFSYSGVWSKMIQNKVDAIELSAQALVDKGLVQERETESGNTSYTGLRKVYFGLGEPVEVDINGETKVLYPLVDSKAVDYTPRNSGEGVEAEVEE